VRIASEELSQVGIYPMVVTYEYPEWPDVKPAYELFNVTILDKADFAHNNKPYFAQVPPKLFYVDPKFPSYDITIIGRDNDP